MGVLDKYDSLVLTFIRGKKVKKGTEGVIGFLEDPQVGSCIVALRP